jgi:hypothetical protein
MVLVGCAEQKPIAATRLPTSSCFGAFTPAELAPLLGRGDEIKVDSPVDLKLTAERRGATCNIYVDGKSGMLAWATRQGAGEGFSWPLDGKNPDSIPGVENGKVWDTGAAAGLTCKGEDPFELELWIGATADSPRETRAVLMPLMQKFVAYAKEQAQCRM